MQNLVNKKIEEYIGEDKDLLEYKSQLDPSSIERAFNGQSQFPERHAAQAVVDYCNALLTFKISLHELIKSTSESAPSKAFNCSVEEIVEIEFEEFQRKLKRYFDEYISAESKCISWHVTGPARFPVAKAEKANKNSRDKLNQYADYPQRALKAIAKKLFPDGDGSVVKMSSDNPVEQLRIKISEAETMHGYMKIANRLVPAAYKASENGELTDKSAAVLENKMLERGIPQNLLKTFLEPNPIVNTWGRFSLANSNANIRRLKQRLVEAERVEESRNSNSLEGELENGIKHGVIDGRIGIWLGGRPPKEVTQRLRKFSFKFSPTRNNAWVRAHTVNAEAVFKRDVVPFLEQLDPQTFD
ncbi:hypothetical protein C4D07_RS24105 [Vibrio parahaemolyticus]|nr:hypothetical protein [Vibrio parahaemolyticus]